MGFAIFSTAEGYVKNTNGIYSYVFNYTDHLGNVRLSYSDTSKNGLIKTTEILEETHYYPFGELLPNRNSLNYRYAFQGQELDTETNMEAFQLRLWDGRIGRWLSPDPYGQHFSPYTGMGNNPISRIDPDGGVDWYVPKGETDQGKAVWIDGSGPQKGFDWLGGENFNFDGYALNEVIVFGKPKTTSYLDNYFSGYFKYKPLNIKESVPNYVWDGPTAGRMIGNMADSFTNSANYVKAGGAVITVAGSLSAQPELVAGGVYIFEIGANMSLAASYAKTGSHLLKGEKMAAGIEALGIVGGRYATKGIGSLGGTQQVKLAGSITTDALLDKTKEMAKANHAKE